MRNRYVDLIRFLAIIRVVVYHTTGWAFLTIAFPAMSVMFALAGSLMAASLDRSGNGAVGRRLRRLLPSLWLLAVIFVPAMLLTGLPVSWRLVFWIAPVADPPSNSWGALALSAIWYLRDYLWFVLASPLALWLFRRYPLPTLAAPYVLLVVVELGFPTAPLVVREFGLYFGAWLLGFAHHDGLLRRISRRVLVPVAVALAGAGAAWFLTHPGPRGFDLNDIRLGNGLWSAGFTLLLLGLAPSRAAWVERNEIFSRAVTVLNRRALTIYLWHMPIVIGLTALMVRARWSLHDVTGTTVRLLVVTTLVALAVGLFGWMEDLAARRPTALLPGAGPRRTTKSPPGRSASSRSDGHPSIPAQRSGSGTGPVPSPSPATGPGADPVSVE
ncbi:peptidoglycan/LPS O-acetylase OafA/YrhL [Micromonospora pisi]|uniref:Peptidoglycan/LPS O-acetylase OafA/YrhL n=1 Tax=Micromonospora pisi TaxID=589240 RepID=A0A495JFN8_9ACTN|nr:acyltransferase [Micromonospora pisi]RKR87703.1 peptidoglycan/LPS O-acetylase OafA/YrhL [Micromonospora pisi]